MPVTLSQNSINQIAGRLDDSGEGASSIPEPAASQTSTAGGGAPASSPEADVKPAADSPAPSQGVTEEAPSSAQEATDPEEEKGHAVPYGRFKKVIDRGNKWKAENEALTTKTSEMEARIQQLERDLEMSRRYRPEPEKEDDFSEFDDAPAEFTKHPEFQKLQKQMDELRVQREEQRLISEFREAQTRYPKVDQQILLDAVRSDPSMNVLEVAERLDQTFAAQREAAIAEYLAEQKTTQPQATAAPPAAPRPRSSGGAVPSEGSLPTGSKKFGSVRQATEGLFKHLRDSGWAP